MHGYSIVIPAQADAGGGDASAPGQTPSQTATTEQPADGAPQTPEGKQPGLLGSAVPFILLFAVMYLLILRPQQKKQKEHREMVSRLKAGDRVYTNGGVFGTIVGVSETLVKLEIAKGVEIEVVRSAVNVAPADDAKDPAKA
jgi:preprotein translocase subunit YajC